jgi:hypothetical protein
VWTRNLIGKIGFCGSRDGVLNCVISFMKKSNVLSCFLEGFFFFFFEKLQKQRIEK